MVLIPFLSHTFFNHTNKNFGKSLQMYTRIKSNHKTDNLQFLEMLHFQANISLHKAYIIHFFMFKILLIWPYLILTSSDKMHFYIELSFIVWYFSTLWDFAVFGVCSCFFSLFKLVCIG